jgi:hypothetical protein
MAIALMNNACNRSTAGTKRQLLNQDLQGSHYQRINTTTERYDLQQSSQNIVELPCISAEQPYDMEVPLWLRKASFEWIHPELKPLINQFHVPLILRKFHPICNDTSKI